MIPYKTRPVSLYGTPTVHILIEGFAQKNQKQTGVDILWEKIINQIDPTVHKPYPWYSNWALLAKEIKKTYVPKVWVKRWTPDVYIKIYAYSWGGASAVRLATEFQKLGIKVQNMVLSDPIYRSQIPVLGWFRSLLNKVWAPVIKIPANVETVTHCFQREGKPQGHKLVAVSLKTFIAKGVQVKLPHTLMDSSGTFHNLTLNAAR